MKKNLIINFLILSTFLLGLKGITYASSKVLISKTKLYPNYIKTPQDIDNWLIAEGFVYKSDKTEEDEWKTPEQTVKDKAGDCEDYAVLTAYILEDLGYKNVMIITIYGKDLAHGICWFQESTNRWSFFSVGADLKGNSKFYWASKTINVFTILYNYFPEWSHINVCDNEGYSVKTFHRKDVERRIK